MERDIAVLVINHKAGISTHTLTWSVTVYINQANGIKPISTHTLTWSVTICIITRTYVLVISTHTLTWSVTNNERDQTKTR